VKDRVQSSRLKRLDHKARGWKLKGQRHIDGSPIEAQYGVATEVFHRASMPPSLRYIYRYI
jgi:hypothetical protein